MVNFNKIRTDKCPRCGCSTIVRESVEVSWNLDTDGSRKIWKHTNGDQSESREFLCGCVVSYSPNFCKDIIDVECSKNPKIRDAIKKAEAATAALNAAIHKLDVPAAVMQSAANRIQSLISARDIFEAEMREERSI